VLRSSIRDGRLRAAAARRAYLSGGAGVNLLSRPFAIEWAPLGIRINASPARRHRGNERLFGGKPQGDATLQTLKRFGDLADIADAVCYRAGPQVRSDRRGRAVDGGTKDLGRSVDYPAPEWFGGSSATIRGPMSPRPHTTRLRRVGCWSAEASAKAESGDPVLALDSRLRRNEPAKEFPPHQLPTNDKLPDRRRSRPTSPADSSPG